MGDFNMELSDSYLKGFLECNNLTSLIKGKSSCIDLILTNRKYPFKFTAKH